MIEVGGKVSLKQSGVVDLLQASFGTFSNRGYKKVCLVSFDKRSSVLGNKGQEVDKL